MCHSLSPEILKTLETADDKDDETARATSIGSLSAWLAQNQKGKTHTPTDPNKLPFRTPDSKVRAPIETAQGFKTSLFRQKPVHLAGPIPSGGIQFAQTLDPLAPPTAADLAETEDIQLTPAIRAKAAEFGNHPVQIHNWVRNNIEFLPTYGSIQGADMTLQTKRGNAFDTASLEIALMRAAGIPARYVYGTIQIPADQAMNWVGGVTKPEAAQQLMGQGGIPNIGLISGGQIKFIKLEHVWVEAFVDYVPSRGAVNKVGDTWVPMDASYKQYTYSQGMDIKTAVPLDANSLLTQAQSGATVNQTEGWVQNLNSANIQNALNGYQTQVKSYIDATKPNATVGDVLGTKTILQKNYSILMGTLQYKTLAVGSKMSSLPDSLRHKFQFDLYASEYDKALENPSFTYKQSLPSLAGKKVTLAYEAASPADQAVIDNAYNTYQTSLPAYLIHVNPVLKIEGVTVATGSTVTMGERQLFGVTTSAPWYGQERDYKVTAGDLSVLGINPAGITPEIFSARTTQHDLSQGNDPDFTAEMFNQIMLGWWGEKYAFNDIIGATNQVIYYQLPSHGIAAAPLTVHYFFGFARSANYQSRTMDAKEDLVIAEHANSDPEQRRRFALALGQVGSYLEAGIYDQAFLMAPGHSMSSITALKAANDKGIPIYTIDQSNVATALPQIGTDADTKADIQNAVAAGLRVTVPKQDITVDNFTGMGYILEDPQTGAAAYMVSGGRNGNNSPAGQSVYPMPQPIATPIHNLMLRSSLRDASAGLVGQNGIVMGIAFTAVAPAAGAAAPKNPYALAIMAVIVALIIYSSNVQEIENRYPRTSRVLRHFTKAAFAILIDASKFILGSQPGGTFNTDFRAVYLAESTDPQAAASCPPTADQSASITRDYQLPFDPPDTPLTRVSGYVDIEITRAGYWDGVMKDKRNKEGTREVVVELPFLYFGPYAVAIQQHGDACY